jgi:IS30 family transposase
MEDRRCKLGLAGRLELVELIERGASLRAAAAALNVAPATAHRWWHRWRAAPEAERVSRACLATRRPVPRSCPWALTADQERAILDAREKTNWGPMQLTALTGRHRSTNWKVLHRHGVSRRRRGCERRSSRRYEWTEAGALLHIDAFEVPKFERPGHWAHGDRADRHRTRRAGKTVVVGVIDDHTRLAYCELHSAENAANVSGPPRRPSTWRRQRRTGGGIAGGPRQKLRPRTRPTSQPRSDAPLPGSKSKAAGPSKRSCPTTRSATRPASSSATPSPSSKRATS